MRREICGSGRVVEKRTLLSNSICQWNIKPQPMLSPVVVNVMQQNSILKKACLLGKMCRLCTRFSKESCRLLGTKITLHTNTLFAGFCISQGSCLRYIFEWEPSQYGGFFVYLQPQRCTCFFSVTSNLSGTNPLPLCEASQKGCFWLLPQEHQ